MRYAKDLNRGLKILENIKKEEVFKKGEKTQWKCRNCGYIHEGATAPEICPACKHPKAYFELLANNF
jgi:rubrerythrin